MVAGWGVKNGGNDIIFSPGKEQGAKVALIKEKPKMARNYLSAGQISERFN
jgi:hypothetical protein